MLNSKKLFQRRRERTRTALRAKAALVTSTPSWARELMLPVAAADRARVRALVQTVCSEVQPLNNLGVMKYLKEGLGVDADGVMRWYGHWIERGFTALETWLNQAESGAFCHGDQPTLADCFLVPQVYNAERFNCDLQPYSRICEITARCRSLEAFAAAAPEIQPDAEN